jgi:hypothetical protein
MKVFETEGNRYIKAKKVKFATAPKDVASQHKQKALAKIKRDYLRIPKDEHLEEDLGIRTLGPLPHVFVLEAEPFPLPAFHPQQGDHHLQNQRVLKQ